MASLGIDVLFKGTNFLRLLQVLAAKRAYEVGVGCHSGEAHLVETVHGLRALGIHVITEKRGVHTRIGGEFHLVELLYDVESHLGGESELAVAVHL